MKKTTRKRLSTIVGLLVAFSIGLTPAQAQLEPFTDYEISEAVWEIGTVKVKTNAGDHYLEGLKATWVRGQEIGKDLGHIEDYAIYSSITPESGDFNLLLVTKYASLADLAPSKEKYDAFISRCPKELLVIPQKYLASYLGMTPETFSRLRAQRN